MKIKINESKILEFEMDTAGCSWKELQGFFRLTLEGVEYGFPAKFEDGMIRVEIPAFKKVLHESTRISLEKNKEVIMKGRLDIIANNEAYISPWSGNVEIEIPVSIKVNEEKKKVKEKVVITDIKEKETQNNSGDILEEKEIVDEVKKKKSKFTSILEK